MLDDADLSENEEASKPIQKTILSSTGEHIGNWFFIAVTMGLKLKLVQLQGEDPTHWDNDIRIHKLN